MTLITRFMIAIVLSGSLASCASGIWGTPYSKHEVSSVMGYLYPDNELVVPQKLTHLNLPVKVGIAFTPTNSTSFTISEEQKITLLNQVKVVFEKYPYISKIEVIPSSYLRVGGGFENLTQVGRMFGIDVMAMVSYDQIQFDDPNKLSFLYWSIIGAYMIKGDQHDTQTMVDTSVFDIHSQKLLFRAPGQSSSQGTATAVNYREAARSAQQQGYQDAITIMIPNLEKELAAFKERIKQDSSIQVHHRSGYSAGGSFSWLLLILFSALLYLTRTRPL